MLKSTQLTERMVVANTGICITFKRNLRSDLSIDFVSDEQTGGLEPAPSASPSPVVGIADDSGADAGIRPSVAAGAADSTTGVISASSTTSASAAAGVSADASTTRPRTWSWVAREKRMGVQTRVIERGEYVDASKSGHTAVRLN